MGLLLSLWLLVGSANAEVIDRVVAAVEEQLVTESEVALEGQLSRLDSSPSPFWSPTHGDPLQRLIDAAVVRELAGDVQLYQPTETDVSARLEAVRAHFTDRSAWQSFTTTIGMDEEQLRTLLRRRMVVERYLNRSIQVRPNDPETWLLACDELLSRQREGLRIRRIPPIAP